MTTTEEFEQAYRNVVIAAARLHVATMFAQFEQRLIEDLVESVDSGDIRLADVLSCVPGNHQSQLIQGHFKLRVTGTQTEGGKE